MVVSKLQLGFPASSSDRIRYVHFRYVDSLQCKVADLTRRVTDWNPHLVGRHKLYLRKTYAVTSKEKGNSKRGALF